MVALSWPTELVVSGDAGGDTIRKNEVYRHVFDGFYRRLDNLPVDVLVDELEEQIESALMRGQHISPPDLQDKIMKVERKVFDQLKQELCPVGAAGWSREQIELSGIESLGAAVSNYRVQNGDYARIASVLVRILEATKASFCESSDFSRLAP